MINAHWLRALRHKVIYQHQFRCIPIACATKRALLMFLTSVRVPSGSPGWRTDTLASTLNEPSAKRAA